MKPAVDTTLLLNNLNITCLFINFLYAHKQCFMLDSFYLSVRSKTFFKDCGHICVLFTARRKEEIGYGHSIL